MLSSQTYSLKDIKECFSLRTDLTALLQSQKQAFIDFSQGHLKIPLPMQLYFSEEYGDCHIKAGFKKNDCFVYFIYHKNLTNQLEAETRNRNKANKIKPKLCYT